ncbi:MAG: hypothetical protein V4659_13535 [Pseudomonadota bacterium]
MLEGLNLTAQGPAANALYMLGGVSRAKKVRFEWTGVRKAEPLANFDSAVYLSGGALFSRTAIFAWTTDRSAMRKPRLPPAPEKPFSPMSQCSGYVATSTT